MASQTKSEPVERATPDAQTTSSSASTPAVDAQSVAPDSPPASNVGSVASGQDVDGDDEDVSLDELMISDSNDDEDEGEASTDVPSASATNGAAEGVDDDAAGASAFEPLAGNPREDDEAAALAAAAAEQEAAAQAAVAEADARAAAARRKSEPPPASRVAAPRRASAPPPPPDAEPRPAVAAASAPTIDAPAAPPVAPADESPVVPEAAQGAPPLAAADAQPSPPPAVDVLGRSESRPAAARSPSTPPPSGSGRLDAPLPSFDIPGAEGARAGRRDEVAGDVKTSSRANARPLATPLSHLSEVSEDDDDDAVTHIGLPVVPEAPGDYSEPPPSAFQPVDLGVAALHGLEPDLSLADARRATTRLVPRLDPAQLEQRRASSDTSPALSAARRPSAGIGAWLSGLLRRVRSGTPPLGAQRRSAWLLDTVLPPLSLVLFGSGIGAGIMLLQPDRGAKAAQQPHQTQQAQTIQALQRAPTEKLPTTLTERAESGDGDALFKITNMAPSERSSALTLSLERGYQAQKLNEFKEFARQLDAPSGLATPDLTGRFLSFATNPETMLPAFAHLLEWPGATGPDVLYAVWEKAPGGNRAASLAQQLLHSADQRAKATPALSTALDLRSATSCDDYLRVLPAVQRSGDQRCSATLRALEHRDGCGDDGRQDCFACLRESTLLDDALKAIEGRPAPRH